MSIFQSRKPGIGDLARLGGLWRDHPRYQGLVGHWWMGEGYGLVARDLSPWGNHADLTGLAPADKWTTGQFGPVIVNTLAAIPAFAAVPNSARYQGHPVTVAFWGKLTGVFEQYDIWASTASTNSWDDGWGFYFELSQTMSWWVGDYNNRIASTVAFPSNTWTHVAGTFDGSTTSLYINGVPAGTLTTSFTSSASTGALTLLGGVVGQEFEIDGQMDDVRIWSRALSQGEIVSLVTQPWLEFAWAEGVLARALTGEIAGGGLFTQGLAGVVTPGGLLVKQPAKPLAGAITPSGLARKQGLKPVSGAMTPAGAMVKLTLKPVTAALTPIGALAKLVAKPVTAALTPIGALAKLTLKVLSGACAPTGALGAVTIIAKMLAGAVAPVGSLARLVTKSFGGVVIPSGGVIKSITKSLEAMMTPAGALATAKFVAQMLAGVVAPVGALAKLGLKGVGGMMLCMGGVVRGVFKGLGGLVMPGGVATHEGGTQAPSEATDYIIIWRRRRR